MKFALFALAARPAAPLAVKIKPLEWDGSGLEMWADSAVGRYHISGNGGVWSWTSGGEDPYFYGVAAESKEAAFAAAQADYESHILAALAVQPGYTRQDVEAAVKRALKKAESIAANACLVPPDGGSPTDDEVAVCNAAANYIRAIAEDPEAISWIMEELKRALKIS